MVSPFNANVDGVVAGQSGLSTKGLVFNTLQQVLNDSGAVVAAGTPGSKLVRTPGFARYDFTAAASQGTVTAPLEVSSRWGGLLQLIDAYPGLVAQPVRRRLHSVEERVESGENRNLALGARNIPHVKVVQSKDVTTYDLLKHNRLVLSESAAKRLSEGLAK
jgi:hypothetical protein